MKISILIISLVLLASACSSVQTKLINKKGIGIIKQNNPTLYEVKNRQVGNSLSYDNGLRKRDTVPVFGYFESNSFNRMYAIYYLEDTLAIGKESIQFIKYSENEIAIIPELTNYLNFRLGYGRSKAIFNLDDQTSILTGQSNISFFTDIFNLTVEYGNSSTNDKYILQFNHVDFANYFHIGYKFSTENKVYNAYLAPVLGLAINDVPPNKVSIGVCVGLDLFEYRGINLFLQSGVYVKPGSTVSYDVPFLAGLRFQLKN